MDFAREPDLPPEAVSKIESDPEPPAPPPQTPAAPMPEPVTEGPPKAQTIAIPRTLPVELITLLKRPELPATIQQAAAAQAAPKGPKWATGGSPVHGPLTENHCIVYVLDASGSMGEWAKFDAARAALIATLKLQPAKVRFQVVVYSGTASVPLKSAPGECRSATAENIARIVETLEALPAPAGRSNHVEGLRTALGFRPDLVVLFTDADDLPLGPIRGLLKQAERPVSLCVSKLTANGVQPPREVK
ncbi:MAG: vWA domain-containing protein [Gemmataceae bacterium]